MYLPVFALTLTVFNLIASEFLPVSLLTPMAGELGITEGLAGQAVTATAVAAILSSLLVTTVTKGIDRRIVVLTVASLMAASNLLVALAPNFHVLAVGRFLLGISLGSFWSISTSLVMRLVPEQNVPKALSLMFSGVSVAMVLAPPLGSFFGEILGWRGVFGAAAVLSAVCVLWQAIVLPKMPAPLATVSTGIVAVAKRPGVAFAMLALFCGYMGQFTFVTYMRPFYEGVTRLDVNGLSSMLLVFGVANCVGVAFSAPVIRRSLRNTLIAAPMLMVVSAMGLLAWGQVTLAAAAFTALWGFIFGWIPVGWASWTAKNLGDDAENAGGLQVAIVQLSAAIGAGAGGLVLDLAGPRAPLAIAGIVLAISTLVVATRVQGVSRVAGNQQPGSAGL